MYALVYEQQKTKTIYTGMLPCLQHWHIESYCACNCSLICTDFTFTNYLHICMIKPLPKTVFIYAFVNMICWTTDPQAIICQHVYVILTDEIFTLVQHKQNRRLSSDKACCFIDNCGQIYGSGGDDYDERLWVSDDDGIPI